MTADDFFQIPNCELNLTLSAPSVTDSTKIEFSENEKEILDYIIELEE